MKIKIQHDGNGPAYNTKITNAETGDLIVGISRVDLALDVHSPVKATITTLFPKATITTLFPVVDVVAEADVKPDYIQYISLTLADGRAVPGVIFTDGVIYLRDPIADEYACMADLLQDYPGATYVTQLFYPIFRSTKNTMEAA